MGVIDAVRSFLTLDMVQPLQTRTTLATPFDDYPDLPTQLRNIRRAQPGPWRQPSIKEALGVPSILRAVSLISTTTGALSLNTYRKGLLMDPEDRPRIVVRPDPFRKPRDFFRDTAWNMATRGEAWWWVAKRDGDGNALSLLNLNPAEVNVEDNPNDPRYPIVSWRNKKMPNDDMRQITLVQEPGDFRGLGPLQLCGAAVSVSVEAQDWAANFFSDGGYPSLWVKTSIPLSGGDEDADGQAEVDRFLDAWMSKDHNTPRVTDDSVEDIKEIGANPQGAQMLQARDYQTGEAGRMFGMPGSLLDYQTSGSSLTYQNLADEFTKWVRAGLWPYYLEAIEQEMSDLLTGSTTARFNIDALERADIKTRFEVYKLGVDAGVLTPELAQEMEGITAGNVENAPIPFAPPQAIPTAASLQVRSQQVRCDGMRTFRRSGITKVDKCNALLAEAGPFTGTCPKCKKAYRAA